MAELDLADIRQRIDSLDAHIQSLIAERAGLAQAVRAAKGEAASPAEYYRPDREAQVLRNVIARNDGPLADSVMLRLFREIMSACLAQQEPLRVAYLGPEGTFTQQAVFKQFGHSVSASAETGIDEVFHRHHAKVHFAALHPAKNLINAGKKLVAGRGHP